MITQSREIRFIGKVLDDYLLVLLSFCLPFILNSSLLAQTVNPAQTDEIVVDKGKPNQADPGDTIRYKVVITETSGTTDAEGVQLTVTPDILTTLVPGSFKSSPLAMPDQYQCTGNVGITVDAGNGLLVNDFDDSIPGLNITPAAGPTSQGGVVAIASDGGFSYRPAPGFTGMDQFTYTLEDGNAVPGCPATDFGKVTITVTNLIWFVDQAASMGGNGLLTSPFKTLTEFNSGSTTPGDVIFIKHGATNYEGGLVLQDGERLYGEGHMGGINLADVIPFALPPFSNPLPAINGSRPVITNSMGDGILLTQNNEIRGLNLANCADFGVESNGHSGALAISEVQISNTTGGGIRVATGGTVAITLGALTSVGGTNGMYFNNCGGTIQVTGTTAVTNSSGAGIFLGNNSTTVTFDILNITNTASNQAGLSVNGGSINSSSGVINTGSGQPVDLANVALGVSFISVSCNGASDGISLNSTSGSFSIVGTGSTDGSGGTIQNVSIRGGSFINSTNITLRNMEFLNANMNNGAISDGTSGGNENTDENGAIYLQATSNVILDNIHIDGTAQHGINGNEVTNLDISNSVIENVGNSQWESGIYIFQLKGTTATGINTFDNVTIQNTGQFNIFIRNNGATNAYPGLMDRLELTNCTFQFSGQTTPSDHVTVSNRDGANFQTIVIDCTFNATPGKTSDSIQVDAGNTSHSDVSITTSSFLNGNLGINISGSGTATTTFDIFDNIRISSQASSGVNIACNGSATMIGKVRNNPDISSNLANNNGFGVDMVVDQTGSGIIEISDNIISGYAVGVRAGARNSGSGNAQVKLSNNNISTGGLFAFNAVYLFAGNGSSSESNTVCLNISANTTSTGNGDDHYFLEQYAGNTFAIQGLTPPTGASQAQVENYIISANNGSPSVDAFGGTIVNYTSDICSTL